MRFEDLQAEALKLPVESRAELAQQLILSLDTDPDEPREGGYDRLWREEIERRRRDLREGRATLIPAEEVFEKIRASLE